MGLTRDDRSGGLETELKTNVGGGRGYGKEFTNVNDENDRTTTITMRIIVGKFIGTCLGADGVVVPFCMSVSLSI